MVCRALPAKYRDGTPVACPDKNLTSRSQAMNRNDVTEKIITAKVAKGIQWSDVAKKVGLSKEWVTAACLGQMTLDAAQAKVIGKIFGLTAEEQKWLQVVPYKGSLSTPVPTAPLRDRSYAAVSAYRPSPHALNHQQFG